MARWTLGHRALAGLLVLTVVGDPGEEVLFVGEIAPWLEALAPLLGCRARRLADADALWPSIGPRTRAVVLAAEGDALAVLAETDVAAVLVDGPVPDDFDGLSLEGSVVALGPCATSALRRRVAHVARVIGG